MIDRVTASAESNDRMPPAGEGVALDDQQVRILRAWINQGATAPAETTPADPRQHWAYLPPARPAIPARDGQGWARNPIDAFLAAAHQAKGLKPSAPVNNDLLLRRVYLDLVGLTPTRRELHEFRDDRSPGASRKSSIDCWPAPDMASAGSALDGRLAVQRLVRPGR